MRAISQQESPETYYELQEDNSKKHQDRLFSAFALSSLVFCMFLVLYCRSIQAVKPMQPKVEGVSNLDKLKNIIQTNLGEAAVGESAPDAIADAVGESSPDTITDAVGATPADRTVEAALSGTHCGQHSDCKADQYCWAVSHYRGQVLGAAGYCDNIDQCCQHHDSIDQQCPSGSGCALCSAHSDCVVDGQFCSDDSGQCEYCHKCKFDKSGVDGTCGSCPNGPTLTCDNHAECRFDVGRDSPFCMKTGTGQHKCESCDKCDCNNGIENYVPGKICGTYCPDENKICEEQEGWVEGWVPDGTADGRAQLGKLEDMPACKSKCAKVKDRFQHCFYHRKNNKCLATSVKREVIGERNWFLSNI